MAIRYAIDLIYVRSIWIALCRIGGIRVVEASTILSRITRASVVAC